MPILTVQICVPSAAVAAGEDELVTRLRSGEGAAVAEVYDAHAEALFGFARRLVGDEAAAEDLVHEVFVSLPQAMKHFAGTAKLRTYLLSIAVNHARHHVRAAARRRAAMVRYARETPNPPVTPEEVSTRAALARALTGALDALPLEQRVAFVLCEVEERTAGEASLITGAPEATMRSRLFHAKTKLRELLSRRGIR